jgi:hypothetical protein
MFVSYLLSRNMRIEEDLWRLSTFEHSVLCVRSSNERDGHCCQLGRRALEEVTFVQLSAEAYQYRDAVRFRDGREVLLQRLRCGQRVEVLSLCSSESREEEHLVQALQDGFTLFCKP